MVKKVKIGLVQMRCSEKKEENLNEAVLRVKKLADKGAKIICLPELFLTKYFCQEKNDEYFKLAEEVPGPTTEAMGKIAKETDSVILCPLFEKTKEGKYFNSVAVIGTKGEIIGVYHKMHIPSLPPDLYAENYYFEKGNEGFPVFDTLYGKIAPLICYDQWFPEAARIAASKGAQIIFYPTAIGWPLRDRKEINEAEFKAWQTIQRSHAIANNVFVAAVNRVGVEKNLNFWGGSFVSDPYGRVIVKAGSGGEENLIAECDFSLIESMRKEWPFLDERHVKCENNPL